MDFFFMFKVIVTIILIQKHKTPSDNYTKGGFRINNQ